MDAYDVLSTVKSLVSGMAKRFEQLGLACKNEIRCYDGDGNNCYPDLSECVLISGVLKIYTGDIEPRDGYFIDFVVTADCGRIDDSEFFDECKRYKDEVDSFIAEINAAEDKADFLTSKISRQKAESEMAMMEIERDMRREKIVTTVAVAAGICAVILAFVFSWFT